MSASEGGDPLLGDRVRRQQVRAAAAELLNGRFGHVVQDLDSEDTADVVGPRLHPGGTVTAASGPKTLLYSSTRMRGETASIASTTQ